MTEEKQLTEQESLRLIAEMIQKAKNEFYATGVGALLWGSVVGFCGLYGFLATSFNWPFTNDIWYLTFIAIFPQIYISIKESKNQKVKHNSDGVSAAWIAFITTMIGMTLYTTLIPGTTGRNLSQKHLELLIRHTQTGQIETILPFTPKISSVYFLVYAFPTLITGMVRRFKPMFYGAIICYVCFFISCFTPAQIDLLLQSVAAIACWLVPGLILHNRYRKSKVTDV